MAENQKIEVEDMTEENWTRLHIAYLERRSSEIEAAALQQQIQALNATLNEKMKVFLRKDGAYHQVLEVVAKESDREGWEPDTEQKVWRRVLPANPPEQPAVVPPETSPVVVSEAEKATKH